MNRKPRLAIADERPLSAACCARNEEARHQRQGLNDLIAHGADVGETDKNGVTPLHHAVRFRSPAAVETLIEFGADVNQACKRSGATPLHRAVTSTGAPGTAGKTAERSEIIQLLLQAGADPSIGNRAGKSALDYAKDSETRQLLQGGS